MVFHIDAGGQKLNFGNLLIQYIIAHGFNKILEKDSSFFSPVRQWSSALFGWFIVAKFIKFIIDSIAHGIMLHGILDSSLN